MMYCFPTTDVHSLTGTGRDQPLDLFLFADWPPEALRHASSRRQQVVPRVDVADVVRPSRPVDRPRHPVVGWRRPLPGGPPPRSDDPH